MDQASRCNSTDGSIDVYHAEAGALHIEECDLRQSILLIGSTAAASPYQTSVWSASSMQTAN
jgi:hypothetical protein